MTEILDVKPEYVWSKMEEICNAIKDNQKVCVKAGHSVSKSFTVARLVLWYLYCFEPATVITTAPSHPQVEEILWREIRKAHTSAKVPLGSQPTKTKLELSEKWFALGFATKPDTVTQQATRFQGFHNDHVLVVFDEAAGIMKEIWEAKDSLIIDSNTKFLCIGNPTSARGEFVDCFKDPYYHKITISCLDTPNYQTGMEIIPGLSGRSYVEQVADKYGADSNYYKARVLGQIPEEDADALLQLTWIDRAEDHSRNIQDRFLKERRFITADVADGGDDCHVFKAWHNKEEIKTLIVRDKKVEEAEPYCWRLLKEIGGNAIIVDGDGIGRVLVQLLEASCPDGVDIIVFEGGSTEVRDPISFKHRYSEGHWLMRNDFESGNIKIKKDKDLREELSFIKLEDNARGFIQIEKKKKLKDYIGRSPDRKDAVMMMSACYEDVRPTDKEDPYSDDAEDEYEYNPNTV
jgi:hypothetical protein